MCLFHGKQHFLDLLEINNCGIGRLILYLRLNDNCLHDSCRPRRVCATYSNPKCRNAELMPHSSKFVRDKVLTMSELKYLSALFMTIAIPEFSQTTIIVSWIFRESPTLFSSSAFTSVPISPQANHQYHRLGLPAFDREILVDTDKWPATFPKARLFCLQHPQSCSGKVVKGTK